MSIVLLVLAVAAVVIAVNQLTSAPRARLVPARNRIAEARRLLDRPTNDAF